MTGILIRPARIDDAQGLIDVINPIIRAGGTTALEVEYSMEAQQAFINGIGPRDCCLVAVDEEAGGIVGFQGFNLHPHLPGSIADISTFVRIGENVRIGEKGRGVGQKLSQATFRAARAHGYIEMNATIRADNFEGLAYYTKIGFRDHSVKRAKPLKSGKLVDRISKRRLL